LAGGGLSSATSDPHAHADDGLVATTEGHTCGDCHPVIETAGPADSQGSLTTGVADTHRHATLAGGCGHHRHGAHLRTQAVDTLVGALEAVVDLSPTIVPLLL